MTDTVVIEILVQMLNTGAKLALPILVSSLVVGVGVSVLQTITQIQEMTLTFVPKLLAAAAILVFGGGWMLGEMVAFITELWRSIPSLV